MRGIAQTKPKFAAYRATLNGTRKNNSYLDWLMMCSAILRMFGKISKFFRKSLGKQPEPFAAPAPAPMPERNPIGRPKFAVPGMEIPAENEASEVVETVAAAPEYSQHTPEAITVPFRSILQLLPKELHGKSAASASGSYVLPTAVALEQLSRGAVKVALADLRRAAPAGFVASGGAHDNKMVDLPLREILNQLHPEAFARRAGQNRLTVPDEVTDLFGSKGERLTSVRVVDKSELKPTPRAPAVRAGGPAAAEAASPEAAQAPAQPIRIAPSFAQQLQGQVPASPAGIPLTSFQKAAPVAPTAPGPSMSAVPKVPVAPAAQQLPKPGLSLPKTTPSLPRAQVPAATPTLPPNAIKFPIPPAPRPAAPQPSAAPAPAATPSGGTLSVSINTVNQKWPESIRQIISQIGATDLEIPNELIEPAVKSGRVEFPWEQLVTWLRPAPQGEVALEDGSLVIEMPLSVIAPLYLQQSKYKAKKSSVPGGIPDIFSAKGEKLAPPDAEAAVEAEEEEVEEVEEEQEEVEAEEQTAFVQAAPIQAVPVAPPAPPAFVPSVPDGKRPQSLNELFKEANKKNWTPNEIVHKTITLPGVTGALIALQDGLLVAGTMPPPWKTETIAAFIPQIFGRLTQYTKELQMGEVRTVSFGVESGTLQIFNAGIIYFAALGQHGGSLPVEDLTLIATELSRHTK